MPRRILNTVTTPEYDTQGRHVRNRIDAYFIDPPEPPSRRTTTVPASGRTATVPVSSPPLRTTQAPAPRPVVECYAPPDTGRLVLERQAAQRAGQVPEPPPPPPPRPTINHLACKTCQRVTCRCGVPSLGDMGQRILTLQHAQGSGDVLPRAREEARGHQVIINAVIRIFARREQLDQSPIRTLQR